MIENITREHGNDIQSVKEQLSALEQRVTTLETENAELKRNAESQALVPIKKKHHFFRR